MEVDRPLVMGVVNVTPDSFSDGGRYLNPEAAIARGLLLVAEGADVIDVGGESTRPGAEPVDAAEEKRRIEPVVAALSPHVRTSIDTRTPSVAEAAIAAGATLVNDVSASLHAVAAAGEAGWVAMHMQGDPRTMQRRPHYDDVVAEVVDFLRRRADTAHSAGVEEVWIDPGIGFGKTSAHNLALLGHIDVLVATGHRVVVGASRKRFLGSLTAEADDVAKPAEPDDRLDASLAVAVWCYANGVRMVRAHDVAPTVSAAHQAAGRPPLTTHDGAAPSPADQVQESHRP